MEQYIKPSITLVEIDMESLLCGSQGGSQVNPDDKGIGFGEPTYPDD